MTIPAAHQHPPGVVVTLPQIFEQVQATDEKVERLSQAVEQMVAINHRLDNHHDRLNDHGDRLRVVEREQAISLATRRPAAPWWATVGAVVGIITGLAGSATLITLAFRIGEALSP